MKNWHIRDIENTISTKTHTVDAARSNTHIIFANGFVNGGIADTFASRLIEATPPGIAITTYEEPNVGTGIYAESYRAEILDKVTRTMGGQAIIFAHSRATIAWNAIHASLLDDEIVNGLIALTPIGVSDLPVIPSGERASRLANEMIRPSIDTPVSARASAAVIGQIARRFAHPLLALSEVTRTLGSTTTTSIIRTSQHIPTTVITGSRDYLVPTREARQYLNQTNGYEGGHTSLEGASHLSAFASPKYTQGIAQALQRVATPKE